MTFTAERLPPKADAAAAVTARSSLAIDNLRAVVILLVLVFHSVLAYLRFLPHQPFQFGNSPMLWRAFPIVDDHRWLGFDLFCAWLDVFLMSFFFMLSGLFAWPSLTRKGAGAFLADRVLRLGLPFAIVVGLLMPLTQFPTYLESAAHPSVAEYWREWLALPLWPSGPMWFLWLLLVGDFAVAGLFQLLRLSGRVGAMVRLSEYARRHPHRFLAGIALASAAAYVPLALLFGTQGWYQLGPFALQLCRPLHYAVYFFAGVAIGACGIEHGLLAPDGALARQWQRWLMAALPLFILWCGLTGLMLRQGGAAPLGLQAIDGLSYVAACFASSFMVFAVAVRFARRYSPVLDSLAHNAYGMYLVHYIFVVWLQYTLLALDWPAVAKAAVVSTVTIGASWSLSAALRRIPAVAHVIGANHHRRRRQLGGGSGAAPTLLPQPQPTSPSVPSAPTLAPR